MKGLLEEENTPQVNGSSYLHLDPFKKKEGAELAQTTKEKGVRSKSPFRDASHKNDYASVISNVGLMEFTHQNLNNDFKQQQQPKQ